MTAMQHCRGAIHCAPTGRRKIHLKIIQVGDILRDACLRRHYRTGELNSFVASLLTSPFKVLLNSAGSGLTIRIGSFVAPSTRSVILPSTQCCNPPRPPFFSLMHHNPHTPTPPPPLHLSIVFKNIKAVAQKLRKIPRQKRRG